MTKEEKIKEAWEEYYEQVKNNLDSDGVMLTYPGNYPNIEFDSDSFGYIQPLSLQGIENNNGWSVIPSIHDKEIEKGQYWVMYLNGFIEVAYYDGTIECYKFWKLNFTHYQPIEKPKPPFY